VIPPEQSAAFVAQMEQVLDVYQRAHDPKRPVVCMDETPRQLIGEVNEPEPMRPGCAARQDYEYERKGTCNVFMACEPLAGKRITQVTQQKTKLDWAQFVKTIAQAWPEAEQITLVMDNLNTHTPAALYEAFPAKEAKALWDRFEFVYTPKHGSWLNMAEIELGVMIRQCLSRRIDNIETLSAEVRAWQQHRDNHKATINWQFTTEDSRVKLRRLYPRI
jgi:hypothetical protein